MNKLDSYTPLGYSLCGVITEVGKGAEEFKVGQLVACAGNEQALHAEYNWVPVNLCAKVPDGVAPEHGALDTVAAICMQRVPRGEGRRGPRRRGHGTRRASQDHPWPRRRPRVPVRRREQQRPRRGGREAG